MAGWKRSKLVLLLAEKIHTFSAETYMGKHSQSTDKKIVARIYGFGRGAVFTPAIFKDIGTPDAIHHALSRHTKAGTIRQLARGLYDYPAQHSTLGVLSPASDAVAKALAGRDATRLQPTGAYAANLLGLSDQVPMKVVFLTDGPTRNVRVGNKQIILKRTTPKNMATAGRISGLVIQALRHLGQRYVDDAVVVALRRRLSGDEKQQLLKDLIYAPSWVANIMRQVATKEKD